MAPPTQRSIKGFFSAVRRQQAPRNFGSSAIIDLLSNDDEPAKKPSARSLRSKPVFADESDDDAAAQLKPVKRRKTAIVEDSSDDDNAGDSLAQPPLQPFTGASSSRRTRLQSFTHGISPPPPQLQSFTGNASSRTPHLQSLSSGGPSRQRHVQPFPDDDSAPQAHIQPFTGGASPRSPRLKSFTVGTPSRQSPLQSSATRPALRVLDVNVAAGDLARPPSALKTVPRYMLIFNNLYEICALDVDRNLDQFVLRFPKDQLLRIIDQVFRQPFKNIMHEDDFANKQRLLDIGGNIKDKRAGWYIDVVTDEELAAWYKLYPGQAGSLSTRIGYHQKPSVIAKGTSLHYRVLRKKGSRKSNYVVVGVWTAANAIDGQLHNFVELYTGVLCQALPRKTLTKYLPVGIPLRQPERGLMVANPLSQNHYQRGMSDEDKKNEKSKATIRAISQLSESTDPEIVEHYKDACDYLRSVQYIPAIDAMRSRSKKQDL